MIQLTEKFATQKYTYGWELHETYAGEDAEGNPVDRVRVTYYPSLRLILKAVADRIQGDAPDIKSLAIAQAKYIATVKALGDRIEALLKAKQETTK